jgi:hypothetical protein
MKKAIPYILIIALILIVAYSIYATPNATRVSDGVKLRVGFSSLAMSDDNAIIKKTGFCLKSKVYNPLDSWWIFENTCLNKQYKVDFSGNLIETSKIGKDLAV